MARSYTALILALSLLSLLSATVAADLYPVVVRPLVAGAVQPNATFNYTFNFSRDSGCTDIVKSVETNITTDSYGVGSAQLDVSGIAGAPSYLCEYRSGSLRAAHELGTGFFRDAYVAGTLYANHIANPISNLFFFDTFVSFNNSVNVTGILYVNGSQACTAANGQCDGRYLQSYNETDPVFVASNGSIWAGIDGKLNSTDQRYNDSALIAALNASKLDSLDQRYNDSLAIAAVNTTSNIQTLGFNTTTELTSIFITFNNSQGYSNMSTIVAGIGNWSADKSSYNTTVELAALFYPLSNPQGFANLSQIIAGVGNWSSDKLYYNTTAELGSLFYATSNPRNFINSSQELDPVFVANNGSIWATIGGKQANLSAQACSAGFVLVNYSNGVFGCANMTQSLTESDPVFIASNTSLWGNISQKLDAADQRYNDSVAIGVLNATKLDVNDQRYNDSALIVALNTTKLDVADQRYNESARIDAVNTTANIAGLGFNTTNQLAAVFYSSGNPLGFANLSQIIAGVGNWSSDRLSYNTTAELGSVFYLTSNPRNFINTSQEQDPVFAASNGSLWGNISGKLDASDQRYNDTALILALNASIATGGWINDSANTTTTLKVGIGTATPSQQLHVVGNANITGALYASNVSSDSSLQLQTNGTTRVYINDSTGKIGIGTNNPRQAVDIVQPNGAGALRLESTTSYIGRAVLVAQRDGFIVQNDSGDQMLFIGTEGAYTGRVSIGSSFNPTQALDVQGSGNFSGTNAQLWVNGSKVCTSNNGACGVGSADGTGGWTNDSVNTTTTLKVGIGTTSPTQELHVAGNANVTGTLYASNVSSNSPLQLQTQGVTRVFINDSNGRVGIGTTTPTFGLHVNHSDGVRAESTSGSAFYGTSTNSFGGYFVGYGSGIYATNDLASARIAYYDLGFGPAWGFFTNNNSYVGDRLGIGSLYPTQKLDVNGSGNFSGTNAQLWVNGSKVCTSTNGACAATGNITGSGANNYLTYWTSSTNIANSTLYFDRPNNRLGMGTNTPQTQVWIQGVGGTRPQLTITDLSNAVMLQAGNNGAGVLASDRSLEFRTSSSSNLADSGDLRMLISDSDGNVGIGTAIPTQKIDVNGSGNFSGANAQLWVNGSKVCTQSNGLCGATIAGNLTANNGIAGFIPLFQDNSTLNNSVLFQSGNKVGVGMAAPSETLTVNGSFNVSGNVYLNTDEFGGDPSESYMIIEGGEIYTHLGNGGFIGSSVSGGDWNFSSDLYIDTSTGNVGIGTDSPSHKLTVDGRVNITLQGNDASGLLVVHADTGDAMIRADTNDNEIYLMEADDPHVLIGRGDANSNFNVVTTTGDSIMQVQRVNGSILQFTASMTNSTLETLNNTAMVFRTNYGSRMIITPAGDIGLGTENPQRKVHISDAMRLEPRASAPTSPSLGDLYVDSDSKELCFYNSTAWVGTVSGGACS